MTLLIALALWAQTAIMQPAYLLDHPIDPNLLILATQDGRYPVALLVPDGCNWVHSYMEVTTVHAQQPLWLLVDGDNQCYVLAGDRVDPNPCLTNADGVCDVAAESDE